MLDPTIPFRCAALYLGLAAPIVLTARFAAGASPASVWVAKAALVAMLVGGVVEALGDAQKSFFKAKDPSAFVDKGLYAFLRHPNYTAEQLLWAGSFVTGVAVAWSRLTEVSAWPWALGALLGLAGIQFVLVMATTRLDARQAEMYGASESYRSYLKSSWGGFLIAMKKKE